MKNPVVCKGCKAKGLGPDRACDEAGCGRHHCAHMGKRTGDADCCGPCNLQKHRAAKRAAKGGAA